MLVSGVNSVHAPYQRRSGISGGKRAGGHNNCIRNQPSTPFVFLHGFFIWFYLTAVDLKSGLTQLFFSPSEIAIPIIERLETRRSIDSTMDINIPDNADRGEGCRSESDRRGGGSGGGGGPHVAPKAAAASGGGGGGGGPIVVQKAAAVSGGGGSGGGPSVVPKAAADSGGGTGSGRGTGGGIKSQSWIPGLRKRSTGKSPDKESPASGSTVPDSSSTPHRGSSTIEPHPPTTTLPNVRDFSPQAVVSWLTRIGYFEKFNDGLISRSQGSEWSAEDWTGLASPVESQV